MTGNIDDFGSFLEYSIPTAKIAWAMRGEKREEIVEESKGSGTELFRDRRFFAGYDRGGKGEVREGITVLPPFVDAEHLIQPLTDPRSTISVSGVP